MKCPACGSNNYIENEAGYFCQDCLRAAVHCPQEDDAEDVGNSAVTGERLGSQQASPEDLKKGLHE